MRNCLFSILCLSLAGLLSACLNQIGGGARQAKKVDGSELTLSQKAFRDTLYPILMAQCSQCHAEEQAPLIAVPQQIVSSHQAIVISNLVNLYQASNSVLVNKVRGGHNCWSPSCNEDANALQEAVEDWADRVDLDPEGRGEVTEELLIPTDLANYTGCQEGAGDALQLGKLMTIDLTTTQTDLPPNTTLSFRMRRINSTQYEICVPKITSTASLRVENARVLVNGVSVAPNSSYSLIDVTTANKNPAAANPLYGGSSGLIAPGALLLPIEDGPGIDRISFEFQTLQRIP